MSQEIRRGDQALTPVAELPPEKTHQTSGSVGTTAQEISFPSVTREILILNTHITNTLNLTTRKSLSGAWNDEADETEIPPKANNVPGHLSLPIRATAIRLRGSAASTTYKIIATLE